MKNNKIALFVALFSTGIAGVVVGALIVSKPLPDNMSYASPAKIAAIEEKVSEVESVKTSIAHKLSEDFIAISKEVTPSIVSVYSTKVFKHKPIKEDFYDDPLFKKFFNSPKNPHRNIPDEEFKQEGLGSGVIVDKEGYILTNNHVVEGATDIKVTLNDKRKFKAKVIGTDPKADVAVIKLDKADNLPIAKLGDSNKIEVGEWVLAIGNPLGLTSTVTSGIISAKGRTDIGVADFEDFIQTDAAINQGNSGGALINLQGEVIGINTAIASKTGGYMGIGFAIPSNMAKKVMHDLITKGKVSRGFLGIQIQNMNESLAKSLKFGNPNKGIIVGDVFDGSPSDKAGIQKYDIIIELNGKEVEDVNSFRNSIASTDPGQKVKLLILRDQKKLTFEIKLGELENAKLGSKTIETQEKEPVPAEKLGFKVKPLTEDLLEELGYQKKVEGVFVSEIKGGSNPMEAGLIKGDIIQEINRQRITSVEDFKKATKNIKPGDSVLLKVVRGEGNLLIAFTAE